MPILRNKVVIYLLTRYLTYGCQFLLSLVIAVKLGPYYLGVYGMIQLLLNYCSQINFGISHSLNVYLVHNKNDENKQRTFIQNAGLLYAYVCIILIILAFFCRRKGLTSFGDYNIGRYFFPILVTAILNYYCTVVTTVVRFRNQVNILSFLGSIPVLLNCVAVCLFENENLVLALTMSNLFTAVITVAVGIKYKSFPFPDHKSFCLSHQINLLSKGFYLFIYNSCFYFILIAVRTLISKNYSVEEFGYFTFSYTVANAVMLLLDALNLIIYPKTIDLLSNPEREVRLDVLTKMRRGYVTASQLLAYVAMCCYPFFLLLFPQYQPTLKSINLILLAVLAYSFSYGYCTLLIAQKQERLASVVSLVGLSMTIAIGILMIRVFEVEYSYVVLSMLISYLVFTFLSACFAYRYVGSKYSFHNLFCTTFSYRLLLPYGCAMILSCLQCEYLIWIPLMIYIIFNYRDLVFLKTIGLKILGNPNIINV